MKGTIWVVVRLLLTAALVLVTCLGVQAMKRFLTLPPIRQLSLDIPRLPMKLGEWRGEEYKLDAETFDRTGADVAVNRQYRDDQDHSVTMLLALYRTDPDAGVYHAPTNCYRSNGWRLVSESTVERADFQGGVATGRPVDLGEAGRDDLGDVLVSAGRLHPLRALGHGEGPLGDARPEVVAARWSKSSCRRRLLAQGRVLFQGPHPGNGGTDSDVAQPVQCRGQTARRGQVIFAGHRA